MSVTQDQRQLARNRIETLVRATFAIQGYGEPDPKFVFSIVDKAESHLSQRQMHHPDGISLASIGDLAPIIAAAKPPPANIYGAGTPPGGSGGFASEKAGRRGIDPLNAAMRGNGSQQSGGDSSASGARFDGMSSTDWGSPAGLAKMRDYAIQSGVPWAANNPELLRLGPAALGALAAVQFKQETYKTLTDDASFKAKDVVTLARFAKEQHVDANKLGSAFGKAEKEMTPEERARFNSAVLPHMADSKSEEKRARANAAFDSAEKAHPEKREELEHLREQLKLKGKTVEHTQDMAAAKNDRAAKKDDRAAIKDDRAAKNDDRASGKEAANAVNADAFNSMDAEPKAKPTAKDDKPKAGPEAPKASPAKAPPPKAAAPAPH